MYISDILLTVVLLCRQMMIMEAARESAMILRR